MGGHQNVARKVHKNKKRQEKKRHRKENAASLHHEVTPEEKRRGTIQIGIIVALTLLAAGFIFYNMR